ncbi:MULTISPECIES: response regulator [Vibrio]|uniref:response regulator n=1 Tax=Vibrio TaxID=662 RepID=UPI0002E8650D|nr:MULTISPECIES: response regulator [Vibrio]MCM5507179.1 response regulator [Vibrio sp. SCSIO 43169]MDE3896404.1 response regulator [Vibrio sp. CC007]QFT36525.1 Aerobic respiration control sensor protein ArcB [Vibrio sp. THAF64]QGM34426.1 Aerobic respiration control sensor protein ArcB [Vibrio sp. THAF191d]QGN69928.1 Aerobic respiration control sensor protein ArcB [Vibrio sp. THAF191c]
MSFRMKTILGIAFIEVVMLIALTFSAMSFLSESNEKQLIQRAHSAASMFAHAAKDAMIATDIATLDDLVQEFMTIEDITYIRVMRGDKELSSDGNEALLQRTMLIDYNLDSVVDGVFDTQVQVTNGGANYGTIDIGFEVSAINSMLTSAQKAIIGIASIEVMLVAIFSFFLGTYLTKSLVKLIEAANTVSEQGPGFQLNDQSKDELGDVARAFDDMSVKLEKSYHDLKSARFEAEQANESKSRFLASMSHEIRTPMNGVLGILNILEESKLSREQKKLVNTATESGQFLLSIINDILDFTRMESNTLRLEHKPFNFRQCVENVVETFQPSAKVRSLDLNCILDGSVPANVQGDENRVKQILHNLIGNAMKFTKEGSVTIQVHADTHEGNQVKIVCKVIDTGVGINRSAMDYLFDEFTMVDQTYSRSQEGSGLGLAICKRLCELMDGYIEAESTPSIGSTFSFSIKLELADQLISSTHQSQNNTELLVSDASILVAEDNKANQLVIREMFKRMGLSMDIAENGRRAIEMVEQYHYDLIFMDISMPEMDGMETCRAIRSMTDEKTCQIPIIALTAHSLSGDKEQFLDAGMNDYLSKPIRLSQLIEKINLFLSDGAINSAEKSDNLESESQILTQAAINHSMNQDIQVDLELVDEEVLEQMIEDTSADVLPMLIDHYIEESNERLRKIYQAMEDRDKETLEFESHTLGSSSLALGNRVLSNLARKIECMCLENHEQQAFELSEELKELAEKSLAALEYRKTLGFIEPAG